MRLLRLCFPVWIAVVLAIGGFACSSSDNSPECSSDLDCLDDESCVNGECIFGAESCVDDEDCLEGETCIGGFCENN